MKVYIGYDEREWRAAGACAKSLREVSNNQIEPEFLCTPKLQACGLLTRPVDHRGDQDYDLVSNELTSTRFNISRFLTPILCQQGHALFVDCDTIFLQDPRQMLLETHARHAVSVVQHTHVSTVRYKMIDQKQSQHPRKNWSSVMLFNCDHGANRRLSLHDVNHRNKYDLHNFYWLADTEIGSLFPKWNWLVNVQPRPFDVNDVGIAHFTLGGPFTEGWPGAEYDDLWLEAAR